MLVNVFNELLNNGEFFYTDCIVIGQSEVVSYKVENQKIIVDRSICIDRSIITDIFQNFSINIDESCYIGGEAAAHGSCGFFYKKNRKHFKLVTNVNRI